MNKPKWMYDNWGYIGIALVLVLGVMWISFTIGERQGSQVSNEAIIQVDKAADNVDFFITYLSLLSADLYFIAGMVSPDVTLAKNENGFDKDTFIQVIDQLAWDRGIDRPINLRSLDYETDSPR